jgi:hypothetical protein
MTASDHAQQRSKRFPLPEGGRPQMESHMATYTEKFKSLVDALSRAYRSLNQLASGPRRTNGLIDEFGRVEEFRLDLAGSANCRTARPVFHNAHFPDKLPGVDPVEQDRFAIEFSNHFDSASEQVKNTVRRISVSEEDLPFGEMRPGHYRPFNWEQRSAQRTETPAFILLACRVGLPTVQSNTVRRYVQVVA